MKNNTESMPILTDESVEVLIKLKELLDRGIITQEEYEIKKKELIGGITTSDGVISTETQKESKGELFETNAVTETPVIEHSGYDQPLTDEMASNATTYCPNCGHALPAEAASFCQYCGTPLTNQAITESPAVIPPNPERRNKENLSSGATLPNYIPQYVDSTQPVNKSKRNKKFVIGVLCALLIVGIVIAAIVINNSTDSSSANSSSASKTTEGTENKMSDEEAFYVGTWKAVEISYSGVTMSPDEVDLNFVLVINEDHTLAAETNGESDGSGKWSLTSEGVSITDGTGANMSGVRQGDQLVIDFGDDFLVTLDKE